MILHVRFEDPDIRRGAPAANLKAHLTTRALNCQKEWNLPGVRWLIVCEVIGTV
ncbi:MAG: hypothetical protein PVI86_12055 [Phycisphaerae bacterium]